MHISIVMKALYILSIFLSLGITAVSAEVSPLTQHSLAGEPADMRPVMTMTIEDSGREIEVASGEMFTVELLTQGGTGYGWHMDTLDKEHLLLVGHETRSGSPKGLLGGKIIEEWSFKALATGDATLGLSYYRAWEGSGKKIKDFNLRLRIK